MSHPDFDAVIFDLDGTLVDTEVLCNATGLEACDALGHPVSEAFFETLAGIDDVRRVALISEHVGAPIDQASFFAEWDQLCSLRFASGIPLKPGVPEIFEIIASFGLPMAVCTSSRRGPASEKIAAAGFGHWLQAVVTVDDVEQAKPAPAPYLLAAQRLGVVPSRCLAFEDSETGASSAMAAGMRVVQVPDMHPTDGRNAHFIATSLLGGAELAGLRWTTPN